MIPCVMIDLRPDDIRTQAEMDEALRTRIEGCRLEFEVFVPVAIVMHDMQVKWLKLEKFEREHIPSERLRQMRFDNWHGIPVFAVDDWERMPCPNCGQLCEDSEQWYDKE